MRSKMILLLLTIAIGADAAAPASGQERGGVTPKAVDKTLGMALMSAVVDGAGNLVRGSGATYATRPQVGYVRVGFDRLIEDCSYVAGPINSGAPFVTSAWHSNINEITVTIRRSSNEQSGDSPFHLIVFCWR